MTHLRALHHVQLAIPPGSEAECRRFWSTVLGCAEIEKPPDLRRRGGCWFRAGATEIHLGVEADFRPAVKAHPGFLVENIHGLARLLEAAGVPVDWDGAFPGFERFFCQDPFGNRLEFLEAAPRA